MVGCPISEPKNNQDIKIHHQSPSTDPSAVGWPSRCTWTQVDDGKRRENDPHYHQDVSRDINHLKPLNSVLDCIGKTPIVELKNFARSRNLKCKLFAKCEFMNPGGSVKDRIALRMIDDAEQKGRLVPNKGYTIIEPTSGNTGIGLAMISAVRGYNCIIVMPKKMSNEKQSVLTALGAQIVRTPTEANFNDPDSHISKSMELQRKIPNSIVLNQYRSVGNPIAHYDGTATEILTALDKKVDLIVGGAGTGGTITGVARKIRDALPSCKIAAVDPVGSILAQPEQLNKIEDSPIYDVEGIGYEFVPTVLDRDIIDLWIKTKDKESFTLARELMRTEGLLVGGSSGSALVGALESIEKLGLNQEGKQVVVILPDSIRNYMTKFLNDDWMKERNYL